MAINLANNNSLASITALPAIVSGGAMTLISTATASSSATLSFTSGIDDTYDEYVFKFIIFTHRQMLLYLHLMLQ